MSTTEKKQKAFAVFAFLNSGKIANMAVIELKTENTEMIGSIKESHKRIGTIHASDLYIHVHKGFAGKAEPDGKRYCAHEKGIYIPYSDESLKGYMFMCYVSNKDFEIARDNSGRPILMADMKTPMVVQSSKINYAELVPTDRKTAIEENIAKGMKLPMRIYSTDSKISFTLYMGDDRKVHIRPKSEPSNAQQEPATAKSKNEQMAEEALAGVSEMVSLVAINDDLPF
jgi:hypothetical protein